jgi:uncharacterized protein
MDWTSAIALGLVGSVHCAGMCGPLALALPFPPQGYNSGASPRTQFLLGRLAYNLGRIATYCTLGLVFGLVGKTLVLAGVQRWLSIALGALLLAGLLASSRIALYRPVMTLVEALKTRMGSLLRRRSVPALGLLGLLNGLLPCGLVYVACAGATDTGGVLSGARYMALFGLGTVPMMLGISLSGRVVPFSWRLKLSKAIPVSVFLLSTLLILRGMSLGIPYVRPDISGTSSAGASCCHK